MFFSFFDRNVSFKKKKKNNVVANLYTKRFEKNVLSFYSFIKHFLREFVF